MQADDHLSSAELAALAALPREIATPSGLEDRAAQAVVRALRSGRLWARAARRVLTAVCAGTVFAAGWGLGEHRDRAVSGLPGGRFLLVLREGPAFQPPATLSPAALVQEYGAWARDTPTGDGVISGLFIVRAADEAQALEIGRGCPHLRCGGVVEVRRIVES